MTEIVYDSGALIALDRRPGLVALERHCKFIAAGFRILVPAVVAAQVVRNTARQVRLMRALAVCKLIPFESRHIHPVGRLLSAVGTSDVVDAFVALVAAESGGAVVTSDEAGIRRLLDALGARAAMLTA
jgi:predicted nucleic acid-binding protein